LGNDRMSALYRQIFVWKHRGDLQVDAAVRYCCFESLKTGLFHVQSADFFRLPVNEVSRQQLDRQCIELLVETDPQDRTKGFASLEEAIAAHDRCFYD
jgi:hypothetical protein